MSFAYNVPDYVENVDAYANAVEARIRINAVKGKRKRFLAGPKNAELIEQLRDAVHVKRVCGENGFFCHGYDCPSYDADDPGLGCGEISYHPNGKAPAFLAKLYAAFSEWGDLSPKQAAAARVAMDRNEEELARRAAAHAAKAARSQYVGEIGKRVEMVLKLVSRYEGESNFGPFYIHGFEDDDGNVIVQKGAWLGDDQRALARGDRVRLKGSFKSHSEYQGVKQSQIARVKILEILPDEGN